MLTEQTRAIAMHVKDLNEEVKNGALIRSSHAWRVATSSIA